MNLAKNIVSNIDSDEFEQLRKEYGLSAESIQQVMSILEKQYPAFIPKDKTEYFCI